MTADEYREKAYSLFMEGYNCSQSVLLAFAEECGIDPETALMISSPFGGGMGRMREVCGAFSGMLMAVGLLYGYSSPEDKEGKAKLYALVQELAEEFRKRNGSIICRELLGLRSGKDSPTPSERTLEYYKKRPCPGIAGEAAAILAEYIEKTGKKETTGRNTN